MRAVLWASSMLLCGCLPLGDEPTLLRVAPRTFDAELGTRFTLIGDGLLPPVTFDFDKPDQSTAAFPQVSASLHSGPFQTPLFDVQWVDAKHVTARLVGSLAPGTYDVHLVEPRGRELILVGAIEALDCDERNCPLPDGGVSDAGLMLCESRNYRDRDGDGFGAGRAISVCGPGWVPVSGDCNDEDSLTFPGAVEVCNGIDDDCDAVIDPARCRDAGWNAVEQLRSPLNSLTAAFSFAPGSLWVTADSKLFLRRGDIGFVEVSQSCPTNMSAVWAEPGGEAEVAGGTKGKGLLVEQSFASPACSNERQIDDVAVAVIGFREGIEYRYVAVLEDGRLLRWQRGQLPSISSSNLAPSARLTDMHGTSSEQLFAVGSLGNGANQRPMAWSLQTDGGWQEEPPRTPYERRGSLLGVWALTAMEAVAVGEDGSIFVRTWRGWHSLLPVTGVDLTSVRAFSLGRFYVTTSDGKVLRHSGEKWQSVFRTAPEIRLTDITGTGEDDLWVVGAEGTVARSQR